MLCLEWFETGELLIEDDTDGETWGCFVSLLLVDSQEFRIRQKAEIDARQLVYNI